MRMIQAEELIATFIVKVAPLYPHLTPNEIERICRAEFLLLKQTMQSGSLEEVRLQYLFTVRVSPQKIMKQLHYMYLYKYKIRPERYQHYLVMILDYVNKNQKLFNKKDYGQRIRKYTGYTKEQIIERAYISDGYSNHS